MLRICFTARKANSSPFLIEGVHIQYNDYLWCVDYNEGLGSSIKPEL